jgi:hypothetical protein
MSPVWTLPSRDRRERFPNTAFEPLNRHASSMRTKRFYAHLSPPPGTFLTLYAHLRRHNHSRRAYNPRLSPKMSRHNRQLPRMRIHRPRRHNRPQPLK